MWDMVVHLSSSKARQRWTDALRTAQSGTEVVITISGWPAAVLRALTDDERRGYLEGSALIPESVEDQIQSAQLMEVSIGKDKPFGPVKRVNDVPGPSATKPESKDYFAEFDRKKAEAAKKKLDKNSETELG